MSWGERTLSLFKKDSDVLYYIRLTHPCNTFSGCRQSFLEHLLCLLRRSGADSLFIGHSRLIKRIAILTGLWYSMGSNKGDIKKGRERSDMDKESREFLEKRLLILAQKDDVEKMRQETKSGFRQLKDENKTQILEWKEEIKGALDQVKKEWALGIDPVREEIRNKLEGFASSLASSRQEAKVDVDRLNAELQGIAGKANTVTDEIGVLSEKMKEGFAELKEELGSMMKFSFADIEKKLSALEARVKALEKKVLP